MITDRRQIMGGLAFGAAAGLLGPGAWAADPRPSQAVTTASGQVRGLDLGGALVFKGIPYAAPPTGPLRFRPPAAPAPWTGVRDAFAYGSTAPQLRGEREPRSGFAYLYATTVPQGEDCLVLNVWTPATDSGKRPVMVWLHGGAFSSGTGSAAVSDGAQMARREDVVVVSLNHRLNALGYMDVGALDPDFASAVNVGMLDIVAALKWVRDNIARFGGDPSRVMIFGESGGSLKVATLMAMPSAKGLFHAAAMESGAYIQANSRAYTSRVATDMMSALGLANGDIKGLQAVPFETLMGAMAKVSAARTAAGEGSPGGTFSSTMDGAILPRHPFDPAPSPVSAHVPLIIGSNRTETTYINAIDKRGFNLDDAGLVRRVNAMFDAKDAASVLASYRRSYPKASPSDLYFFIGADQWLTTASAKIAERKTAAGHAPAYLYRFDWYSPVDGGKWRAPHTMEIPFVFQSARNAEIAPMVGTAPDLGLASRMSGAWTALARSGSPDQKGLHWPAYSAKTRDVMIFNSNTRVERDPGAAQRRLLEPIVFSTTAGRGDRALAIRPILAKENEAGG